MLSIIESPLEAACCHRVVQLAGRASRVVGSAASSMGLRPAFCGMATAETALAVLDQEPPSESDPFD